MFRRLLLATAVIAALTSTASGKVLLITAGTSFTAPADFDPAGVVKIVAIGAGGNGGNGCNSDGTGGSASGGSGGSGGGYSERDGPLLDGSGNGLINANQSVTIQIGNNTSGDTVGNRTWIKDNTNTELVEAKAGNPGHDGFISAGNAHSQDHAGCATGTLPVPGGAATTAGAVGDVNHGTGKAGNVTVLSAASSAGSGAGGPTADSIATPDASTGGSGKIFAQGGGVGSLGSVVAAVGTAVTWVSTSRTAVAAHTYAGALINAQPGSGDMVPSTNGVGDGGGGQGGQDDSATPCHARSGGNGGTWSLWQVTGGSLMGPSGGGGSGGGHDTTCNATSITPGPCSALVTGQAGCGGNGSDGTTGCGGGGGGGGASEEGSGAGGTGGPACIIIIYVPFTTGHHHWVLTKTGTATAVVPANYSTFNKAEALGAGGTGDIGKTVGNGGGGSGGFCVAISAGAGLTAGTAVNVTIGLGGSGTATKLQDTSNADIVNAAAGGNASTSTAGALGGCTTGSTKTNGAAGGAGQTGSNTRPGASGAASPENTTAGVAGCTSANTGLGAAPGSAGVGGSACTNSTSTGIGTSGTASSTGGSTGGAASTTVPPADGTIGGGGAGGTGGNSLTSPNGGWGSCDSYWSDSVGPCSGGGGTSEGTNVGTLNLQCAWAGTYGGGSGGCSGDSGASQYLQGIAGQGIIVVDYVPTVAANSSGGLLLEGVGMIERHSVPIASNDNKRRMAANQ